MSELSGMGVNERLYTTGLMKDFDRAAAKHDVVELERILSKIELDEKGIADVIEWVLHSPHSPSNKDPFNLSTQLIHDERIVQLPIPKQRVVQHVFEKRGGFGTARCQWQGCAELAVKDIAYCPYCAVIHAGLPS